MVCPNHDAEPYFQEIQDTLSPGSVHPCWNARKTRADPQWNPAVRYYDAITPDAEIQASFDALRHQGSMPIQHKPFHLAVLGPIGRLSTELLSEIFLHCLPPSDVHSLCQYVPPLVLGQVCRFWRQVALSTPALWSTICVNFDNTRDFEAASNLIFTWLSRSGALPLSLTLIADADDRLPMAHLVLEWIMAYAPRWENLELCASRALQDMILAKPGLFPNLRWLEMWMPMEENTPDQPITIFASELKTFCIKWPFILDRNYPWQDLNYREITEQRLGHCLSLIGSAPILQTCTIEGFEGYLDSFNDISLPSSYRLRSNLRSLHLHQLCFNLAAYVLSSLILPRLTELHLVCPSHAQPQIELAYLAYRSQFHLRKLVLRCDNMKCMGCGQFSASLQGLEQLDYLEELEMCFSGDSSWENKQLIQRLTYWRRGAQVLLRSLQVLKLHGLSKTNQAALVDMIESRWRVDPSVDRIARLRSVSLRYFWNGNEHQMERLRKLSRQGLEVVLEHRVGSTGGFF
jgi:hypothetical protein